MNQSEPQVAEVAAAEALPGSNLFRAYTEQQRGSRVQLRYVLVPVMALLVGALGYAVVTFKQEATPYRVETPWGVRTVRRGMSPQDVRGILGQPIGKERRGEQDCYQYGRPTLKVPFYILQTVCYGNARLEEVSERRYNSWVVMEDDAIAPAPLPEWVHERTPPAPPATPAPMPTPPPPATP